MSDAEKEEAFGVEPDPADEDVHPGLVAAAYSFLSVYWAGKLLYLAVLLTPGLLVLGLLLLATGAAILSGTGIREMPGIEQLAAELFAACVLVTTVFYCWRLRTQTVLEWHVDKYEWFRNAAILLLWSELRALAVCLLIGVGGAMLLLLVLILFFPPGWRTS